MNYTKEQLDAMPDLSGSTLNAKLKVSGAGVRVWLVSTESWFGASKQEVVVEHETNGSWKVVKRYPV